MAPALGRRTMSPVFEATIAGWAVTLAVIGGLIAFDLWHSRRSPHLVGLREAAGWSLFYTAVAVLFGVAFGFIAGWQLGGQYFAGYIVERSLSIDNLFVFVIILGTFSVPAERQPSVLMIGIVGAPWRQPRCPPLTGPRRGGETAARR